MEHFTWTNLIPFIGHDLFHVVYSLLALFILISLVFFANRSLKKRKDNLIPEETMSANGFFEVFIEQIYNLSDSVVGKKGKEMVPIFAFLFLFIWIQNLIGLFPGFLSPTENLNTTLALGVFVFLAYNYYGFREHGLSYFKQFLGPFLIMAPLFIFIEILSHIFRPLSLSLRLFGNMKGDHVVLGIFLDLFPVVVPVIFYFLGFFVCTLQAFVFTILTMVYVSLAISHDH